MFEGYFRAWNTAFLATQVVSARLPMLCMLMVDPTTSRRCEAERMFAEKQQALLEGLAAVQHIAHNTFAGMMTSDGRQYPDIFDYFDAMTAPAERILAANAKRLSGSTL